MRPLLFGLAAITVAACGVAGRLSFTPPDVTVQDIRVTGLGLSGGTLDVALHIANPNTYALRTMRGAIDLALDSTPFGTIEIPAPVAVPARGDTVVRLPMTFSWAGVGAGARAMLGQGSVPYTIGGSLDAETPVGLRTVEVRRGGVVTLAQMLR